MRLFILSLAAAYISILSPEFVRASHSCQAIFSISAQETSVRIPVRGGPGFASVPGKISAALEKIRTSGDIFRTQEFWDMITYPKAAIAEKIHQWTHFNSDYKSEVVAVYTKYGNSALLLLDPGVAQFSKQYLDFLNVNPSFKTLPISQIRKQFEDSMPKVEFWRGIVANKKEIDDIRTNGIKGNLFQLENEGEKNSSLLSLLGQDEVLYTTENRNLFEDAKARLGGRNINKSVLRSFSKWIEVTYVGAWIPDMSSNQNRAHRPDLPFYLLKVTTSSINMVRADGYFKEASQGGTYQVQGINGQPFRVSFNDPDFEVFGQKINREDIEIIPYQQRPPRWSAKID